MSDFLAHFSHVRKAGAGWMARCPAHDDGTASLSIRTGDKQPWVLNCLAGCSWERIIEAAGLSPADILTPRNGNGPGLREIVATYDYTAEDGTLLSQAVRFNPKDFRQRRPDGHGGWVWNLENTRRVLLGLPELQGQRVVFVAEGEKDVLRLRTLKLTATTNAGGADKWREDYTQQLVAAGVQKVVILPDNDAAGRQHALAVAQSCHHHANLEVKVVTLPDLSTKGDVSDWLDAGHTKDELITLVKATLLWEPSANGSHEPSHDDAHREGDSQPQEQHATDDADTEDTGKRGESQATAIVHELLEAGASLWHTPAGDGYLSIRVGQHVEHHALASRGAKDYLGHLYYAKAGKAPNPTSMQSALATLNGIARFEGDEHHVHVRVGGNEDRIYLDLCDPEWRAVEVTAAGWQVVTNPPVRFRRPRGVLPLPIPERGGSITDLRPFLNIATDEDFVLLVAWQLAALRHRGPYPILILMAEQGAAKSTTTRVLRRLLDPNDSDARRPPRNTEDLMIAATNGHVVAFDNLSRMSDELSDNLSVLATGGGFAVRQLFTNNEEAIFHAQRPIVLNGIAQVATRGDLLDRAIVVTLPPIPDHARKDEGTFWREYDEARPRILGAVLDAAVCGLRSIGTVHLARKPRMADFAMWAVATEAACPWPAGTFLHAYGSNRQGAVEVTLEGDPVAEVVKKIAPWEGTSSELLAELTKRTAEAITKRKDWFSQPRQVSDALRRLAPALRRAGLDVTFRRQAHTGKRLIALEKNTGADSSPSSPSSPEPENRAYSGDESGDACLDSSPSTSPKTPNEYGHRDDGDAGDAAAPLFSAHVEEVL